MVPVLGTMTHTKAMAPQKDRRLWLRQLGPWVVRSKLIASLRRWSLHRADGREEEASTRRAARSSWGGLGCTAHSNKPAPSGDMTKMRSQVVHLLLVTTGVLSGSSENKVRMPAARGAQGDGMGSRQLREGHRTCYLVPGHRLSLLLLLLPPSPAL